MTDPPPAHALPQPELARSAQKQLRQTLTPEERGRLRTALHDLVVHQHVTVPGGATRLGISKTLARILAAEGHFRSTREARRRAAIAWRAKRKAKAP